MNIYVILKNIYKNEFELERFDEDFWNVKKPFIDPERIIYSTIDIEDEKIKDFKDIIWGRVFEPEKKIYSKVIIPFTPNNIIQMKKEYKEKTKGYKKKYKEIYDNLEALRKQRKQEKIKKYRSSDIFKEYLSKKNNSDSLISEDTPEIDAIYKWIELDYIMPPPKRIEDIKKTYNMPWSKFIKHIQDNF